MLNLDCMRFKDNPKSFIVSGCDQALLPRISGPQTDDWRDPIFDYKYPSQEPWRYSNQPVQGVVIGQKSVAINQLHHTFGGCRWYFQPSYSVQLMGMFQS